MIYSSSECHRTNTIINCCWIQKTQAQRMVAHSPQSQLRSLMLESCIPYYSPYRCCRGISRQLSRCCETSVARTAFPASELSNQAHADAWRINQNTHAVMDSDDLKVTKVFSRRSPPRGVCQSQTQCSNVSRDRPWSLPGWSG